MMNIKKCNKGFSLIELIIAMAISTAVLSGIIAVFYKQVVSHNTERLMVAMQQNVRAAASFMERDIRMARYDPRGFSGAAIQTADRGQLSYQTDLNENGAIDPVETITYAMVDDDGVICDADGNGIADGIPCNLGRDSGVGFQIVARGIDALNFDYLDANGDSILNRTATPWQVPAGQIVNIQSIRVSIVARAGDTIPATLNRPTDTTVYRNRPRDTDGDGNPDTADIILNMPSNPVPVPRHNQFRRMQITTEIDCRN